MEEEVYHIPVLLNESIDALNIKADGYYVDLTFGGGGHTRLILEKLGENGRIFAFDQDVDASSNLLQDSRVVFIRQNFRYLARYLKLHGVDKVDGILGDFGVSSFQINGPQRGFSFRFGGPLDMRMNTDNPLTAATVVNDYNEQDLAKIFWEYGELRSSRKLAKDIVKARKIKKIKTAEDLKQLSTPYLGKNPNKTFAQIFQAIRIEVNAELEAIKEMLLQADNLVKKKGRLVFISYHSLEDRLVKNFIRSGVFSGNPEKDLYGNFSKPFDAINKKVIVPSSEEVKRNGRARSAKLRIAEKN